MGPHGRLHQQKWPVFLRHWLEKVFLRLPRCPASRLLARVGKRGREMKGVLGAWHSGQEEGGDSRAARLGPTGGESRNSSSRSHHLRERILPTFVFQLRAQ